MAAGEWQPANGARRMAAANGARRMAPGEWQPRMAAAERAQEDCEAYDFTVIA
ncbi:hypothetical protein N9250_01825 [bacterium]|nr:hypothetical protein [bacterium]